MVAIHRNGRAGDEIRRSAGQEHGDPGHVIGRTPAPGGSAGQHLFMQSLDLFARVLGQLSVNPAGQHGIDLDIVGGPGGGQRLGELHHRALAGTIGRGKGRAENRHHGADVDDLAAVRAQVRIGGLAADEHAGQVDIHHAVPFLERIVLRSLSNIDARVVHHDVQAAEFLDRRGHGGPCAAVLRHVHCYRIGARAQGFDRAPILLRIAARDHHGGPGSRQALGHAKPDTAIAARHQSDLSRQIKRRHGLASRTGGSREIMPVGARPQGPLAVG
jgi:hypothetical protein